jgi:hypothetical protein
LPKHYNREKREKELNRLRKREEKEQRKRDRATARGEQVGPTEPEGQETPPAE